MSNREKILDAALDVYGRMGFRGATTRMIAEEAGVNEVTIFRQFGSKSALIEAAVIHHTQRSVVDPLPEEPGDPVEEVTLWCERQLAHLRGSRALMRKFMCELQQYPEILARLKSNHSFASDGLARYVTRLQEQGRAGTDFNTIAAVQMLRGAIFSDAMGRDFHANAFPEPEEDAPGFYARLFLRAIDLRTAPSLDEQKTLTNTSHSRSRTHR
jgi:AcrR family transcriptional regulator